MPRKDAAHRILESVSTSVDKKRRPQELKIPSATSASRYCNMWEPYIAANFYLYVVPLGIFLRRARELDFSPKEFHSSLRMVQRVFRVYSPPVVKVLNRLMASNRSGSRFANILSKHESNLGEYALPAEWTLSLTSLQDDMHNLLEEIHIQHQKKVGELDFFDRLAARLEGFVGQGVLSGEEKVMGVLVNQAKTIVGFPAHYEVVSRDSGIAAVVDGQARGIDTVSAARTRNGLLSDYGRQRLLDGADKCNPLDTVDTFDRMKGRPQSHEIQFLVPLLIRISASLNKRFGLGVVAKNNDGDGTQTSDRFLLLVQEAEASHKWRVNLRFLADYRNVLFIVIVGWIWKALRW